MKHLRILVLVLLSILLPVQGAMAAAMLCPGGAGTGTPAAVARPNASALHAGHQMPDERPAAGHVAHHHASGDAPDAPPATVEHPSTCPFCASGCCMASMIGAVPSADQPVRAAAADFPALAPRVAAFLSDGQERPPRTC